MLGNLFLHLLIITNMPVKKAWKKDLKECPYCWNEIKAKAVKCQYCWEFLDDSKEVKTKKSTTRKKKELQIQDLPDKWDYLNSRQKEVLIKNFPLTWWYKVAVFFFPWIFLLYARRYRLYVLLFVLCCIPGLNVIVAILARIIICVQWESLCYNKDSINMKRTLLQYRNKWDKEDPDYDDSEIYGHVGWGWVRLLLIVPFAIVIIWILIASLMPRMQSAQWRARDVARKNDLAQIQTAIITSQWDKWQWPEVNSAKNWIPVSNIKSDLISAGMTAVPMDPSSTSKNLWLWNASVNWEYLYLVAKRNSIEAWWFVLMAKTEIPWGSNWVVCNNSNEWKITSQTDLANIKLCDTISKWDTCSNSNGYCTYSSDDELRYILTY